MLELQLEEDRNYCPEKWQKTCWKYKREDGRNKRTEQWLYVLALTSNEWMEIYIIYFEESELMVESKLEIDLIIVVEFVFGNIK